MTNKERYRMERYRKKELLKTVALLEQANKAVSNASLKHQAEVIDTLIQCQESALEIGNCLETLGEQGRAMVPALEAYCENLYQMSQSLSDKGQCRKLTQAIKGQLISIKERIRRDLPEEKKEVVFLPYKASMWDSLESVWKAADEDPDCRALVIPIPYYDKNPDGSFGELHYEIAQYPEEVPVMGYESYDFEARHPDVIFIHNPYDEGNFVTSVPPFFYSKNLKQFTDKLVYIPYFILAEIDPSDKEAVEGMEHFVTTAGVMNADRVVVQSEAMRQIYVDVLTRHTDESLRPTWEKKILGLGSPKVDRVCGLRREDFELPESWDRLIQREDGSRRKVIFYNTSVTALLKDSEAMMKKIKENLQIFEENREDVVLLWRPHPLTEATLASMRPELMGEYGEMVCRYREAGWGIYDDSPSMDRAIAVSDGYYGDWSSIVWLYQKTGKPIMIQNPNL